MNTRHDSLHSLPTPSKGRGGAFKLGIITLVIMGLTGGGIFWLTRDEEGKKALTDSVKESVITVIKDTPLEEAVSPYIAPPKTSPAPPKTAPGTLSGQNIYGQMSAPPSASQNTSLSVEPTTTPKKDSPITEATSKEADIEEKLITSTTIAEEEKASVEEGVNSATQVSAEATISTTSTETENTPLAEPLTPIAPKVTQDAKVPRTFVDDVAVWLVNRYSSRGGANFNLSSINLRYGQKMHTLLPEGKKDVHSARMDLLRYAFNPPMLSALYNLYAPDFVQSMKHAAENPQKGKKLVPEKVLQAYATEFNILGGVLHGIGAMPDFSKRMQTLEKSIEASLDIHAELTEAVFAYDSAVEKKDTNAAKTAQLRIDGLNAQYQRSIHDRTLAKEALISSVRRQSSVANNMDSDSIVYVAQWLERRLEQGQDAESLSQSAKTAGELLQNLSGKLQEASTQKPQAAENHATQP